MPFFWYGVGATPAVILILYYNASLTGDPFVFLYKYSYLPTTREFAYGFGMPSFESLFGLTLGFKTGLLIYAPALVPILYAFFCVKVADGKGGRCRTKPGRIIKGRTALQDAVDVDEVCINASVSYGHHVVP